MGDKATIPEHCSQVNVIRVDFPLKKETVLAHVKGKKVHKNTRYLVLENGDQRAIVSIIGLSGKGFFRDITAAEVLSLPSGTGYVCDRTVNVHNHVSVSRATAATKEPFVVIEGEFDHVTFERKEPPLVITVLDVVPPYPSKLAVLAGRAIESMTLTRPVRFQERIIDLNALVAAERPTKVVYPCRAVDVGKEHLGNAEVSFLQDNVEVGDDAVLMGCDFSRKMVLARFKARPKFIDMCPAHFADREGIKGPLIIKCCEVEDKVLIEKEKRRVTVPWGVKMEDLWTAINACLSFDR